MLVTRGLDVTDLGPRMDPTHMQVALSVPSLPSGVLCQLLQELATAWQAALLQIQGSGVSEVARQPGEEELWQRYAALRGPVEALMHQCKTLRLWPYHLLPETQAALEAVQKLEAAVRGMKDNMPPTGQGYYVPTAPTRTLSDQVKVVAMDSLMRPDDLRTYKVTVRNGSGVGDGTTANVFVELRGDDKCSGRIALKTPEEDPTWRPARLPSLLLDPSANSVFATGRTTEFKVKTRRLGTVQAVLLGHDGTGKSPNWRPAYLEVHEDRSGLYSKDLGHDPEALRPGQCWRFKIDRSLDSRTSGHLLHAGQIMREHDVDYKVTVVTSNLDHAATNANVWIALHGRCGQTQKVKLKYKRLWPGQTQFNLFERDMTETFRVRLPDVGQLTEITLGKEFMDAWHCQEVRVTPQEGTQAHREFVFMCNTWLRNGPDADDRLERQLPVENPNAMSDYVVTVMVGSDKGAGGCLRAMLTLFGDYFPRGSPHIAAHMLAHTSDGKAHFQSGRTQVFRVSMRSVGELHGMQLRTRFRHVAVNSVVAAGNKVMRTVGAGRNEELDDRVQIEWVEVLDVRCSRLYHFDAHCWLCSTCKEEQAIILSTTTGPPTQVSNKDVCSRLALAVRAQLAAAAAETAGPPPEIPRGVALLDWDNFLWQAFEQQLPRLELGVDSWCRGSCGMDDIQRNWTAKGKTALLDRFCSQIREALHEVEVMLRHVSSSGLKDLMAAHFVKVVVAPNAHRLMHFVEQSCVEATRISDTLRQLPSIRSQLCCKYDCVIQLQSALHAALDNMKPWGMGHPDISVLAPEIDRVKHHSQRCVEAVEVQVQRLLRTLCAQVLHSRQYHNDLQELLDSYLLGTAPAYEGSFSQEVPQETSVRLLHLLWNGAVEMTQRCLLGLEAAPTSTSEAPLPDRARAWLLQMETTLEQYMAARAAKRWRPTESLLNQCGHISSIFDAARLTPKQLMGRLAEELRRYYFQPGAGDTSMRQEPTSPKSTVVGTEAMVVGTSTRSQHAPYLGTECGRVSPSSDVSVLDLLRLMRQTDEGRQDAAQEVDALRVWRGPGLNGRRVSSGKGPKLESAIVQAIFGLPPSCGEFRESRIECSLELEGEMIQQGTLYFFDQGHAAFSSLGHEQTSQHVQHAGCWSDCTTLWVAREEVLSIMQVDGSTLVLTLQDSSTARIEVVDSKQRGTQATKVVECFKEMMGVHFHTQA